MLPSPELIAATLALCALAVVLVRTWRPRRRLIVEAAAVVVLTALLAAAHAEPLPSAMVLLNGEPLWTRALRVGWWVSAARSTATLLELILDLRHRSRQARLLNDLLTTALYVAVALVVLNAVLGLHVGPLIATSGVVAVVIGLALQSTLADLFSGLAIGLELPFHIGDRVALADGVVEGAVVFMSWRSVRVLTDGNDIVTVPNSLIAKSRILNRTARSQERGVQVEVTARPHWPAPLVIEHLRQAILLTPGVLEAPPPVAVLTRVGQRLNGYALLFRVADSRTVLEVKSRLLVQVQRQVHHAGLQESEPPKRTALLKSLTIFETLDEEQLDSLAGSAIERSLQSGENLFTQGELGTSVFVVVSGVLEARRREATDAPSVLGRIGPGEYIGEIGMLTGDPRAVTACALTNVVVIEITRGQFEALLIEHQALGSRVQASVERGLRLLNRDAAALELPTGPTETSLLARLRQFFARWQA